MTIKVLAISSGFLLLTSALVKAETPLPAREKICGKWESIHNQLIVQIYTQDSKFKAKIIWYSNTDGKPLSYWTDSKNPNPALRKRKLLGMEILSGLAFDRETKSWENGMVYDSTSGRTWNAAAYINKQKELKVRGYWHFKFIGKTMTFKRIK
jgi:uncharacterized protein (DUF2147 family)